MVFIQAGALHADAKNVARGLYFRISRAVATMCWSMSRWMEKYFSQGDYRKPQDEAAFKALIRAAVVLNTPSQGFADVSEICRRAGKNPRSMRST